MGKLLPVRTRLYPGPARGWPAAILARARTPLWRRWPRPKWRRARVTARLPYSPFSSSRHRDRRRRYHLSAGAASCGDGGGEAGVQQPIRSTGLWCRVNGQARAPATRRRAYLFPRCPFGCVCFNCAGARGGEVPVDPEVNTAPVQLTNLLLKLSWLSPFFPLNRCFYHFPDTPLKLSPRVCCGPASQQNRRSSFGCTGLTESIGVGASSAPQLRIAEPLLRRRRGRAVAGLPPPPRSDPPSSRGGRRFSRAGTMQTFLKGKRVGYWLSEKKIRKLNFQAFAELCRKRGVEVVQLDLTKPIEDQGPLDVIIHKLTDVILEADQNDSQSLELVQRFQEYIDAHPETIILDPLPAIRTLLDRSKSYELIRQIEAYMQDERICSPPFMELTSACGEDTLQLIEKNGLAFPFICKTRVAHGTNSHEMAIIFNQEGLKAVRPPCVIQSFINHNAVLYKVFVVGESYTVVKRPSLKNFSAGISDRESIFFNSHNVSKPESSSVLTALDRIEGVYERPNDDVIREISKALRQALGVSLFGIDIIINNQTGQHAVIDINAFPGYEGVSEFFSDLLNHIAAVLQGQAPEVTQLNRSKLLAEQTSGIMDERICCASTGCLSVMGKDSSWIVESETNSSVKLQHQRLGCNSAVSPSFQQHCVATLATKASSQ